MIENPNMISLDRDSAVVRNWIHETERAGATSGLPPSLEAALIDLLGSPKSSKFAKASAAYLLSKLKVEKALPIFEAAFGEQWSEPSEKVSSLQRNPDSAM